MTTFGWSFKAPDRTLASSATLSALAATKRKQDEGDDEGERETAAGAAERKRAAQALNAKLYVGNLKRNVEAEKLKDYFSVFGDVEEAIIIKNAAGLSRGFGFVAFSDPDDALRAVAWCAANQAAMNGKAMEVNMAKRRQRELGELDAAERARKEKERDRTKVGLLWEYKWDIVKEDAEVYGPFRSEDMRNWIREGYFKAAPVFVRIFKEEDAEFIPIDEVDFDLFP